MLFVTFPSRITFKKNLLPDLHIHQKPEPTDLKFPVLTHSKRLFNDRRLTLCYLIVCGSILQSRDKYVSSVKNKHVILFAEWLKGWGGQDSGGLHGAFAVRS